MTSINVASAEDDPDSRYLRRALTLARRALGGVGPRAPVGAVIVAEGQVAGEGATQPHPGDHAEVVALIRAGARARGSTLYCTLEPHAHQASVPPCTDAIIGAGVGRVVCAMRDPNPQVDGAGFRQLRNASVEVSTNVSAEIAREAEAILEGFAKHLRTGKPLVTAKFAMTLDGKIATRTGASKWITGEVARQRTHELRAAADAVIVGIGTVLADDPRLTARVPWAKDVEGPRPRLRVVVDSRGRLPASAAMLRETGAVLQVVAAGPGLAGATGAAGFKDVETIELPGSGGLVDVSGLVDELGRRGCAGVLVEGGSRLLGSFFDAHLVDKVVAFVAPRIFGGESAPGAVGGIGVGAPGEAAMLERVETVQAGADLMISGYVVREGRKPA